MWSCSSGPDMRGSLSCEHTMLFSFGAQEGEPVPDEGVGIADHVAPQRRSADEILVYVGEGFHRERAAIVEVPEAEEDPVPVEVGHPRRAAVGLGEVDVTEPGSSSGISTKSRPAPAAPEITRSAPSRVHSAAQIKAWAPKAGPPSFESAITSPAVRGSGLDVGKLGPVDDTFRVVRERASLQAD